MFSKIQRSWQQHRANKAAKARTGQRPSAHGLTETDTFQSSTRRQTQTPSSRQTVTPPPPAPQAAQEAPAFVAPDAATEHAWRLFTNAMSNPEKHALVNAFASIPLGERQDVLTYTQSLLRLCRTHTDHAEVRIRLVKAFAQTAVQDRSSLYEHAHWLGHHVPPGEMITVQGWRQAEKYNIHLPDWDRGRCFTLCRDHSLVGSDVCALVDMLASLPALGLDQAMADGKRIITRGMSPGMRCDVILGLADAPQPKSGDARLYKAVRAIPAQRRDAVIQALHIFAARGMPTDNSEQLCDVLQTLTNMPIERLASLVHAESVITPGAPPEELATLFSVYANASAEGAASLTDALTQLLTKTMRSAYRCAIVTTLAQLPVDQRHALVRATKQILSGVHSDALIVPMLHALRCVPAEHFAPLVAHLASMPQTARWQICTALADVPPDAIKAFVGNTAQMPHDLDPHLYADIVRYAERTDGDYQAHVLTYAPIFFLAFPEAREAYHDAMIYFSEHDIHACEQFMLESARLYDAIGVDHAEFVASIAKKAGHDTDDNACSNSWEDSDA